MEQLTENPDEACPGPSVVPAVPPAQVKAQSGGIVMSPTISGHIGGSVNINITVNSTDRDRGFELPSEDSANNPAESKPLAAVYQERFKSNLRKKYQVLCKKQGKKTLLNDVFSEIYITEGGSGEVNKEHEVRQIAPASMQPAIPEKIISFEDLFKTLPGEDDPIRTVMTKGVAGIGKTVLANKYALDWTEDKANQNVHSMFPFSFRELNRKKDTVFSMLGLLHHYFPVTEEAEICSSDGSGVVFIFDGLDECRIPLDFENNEILTDVTKPASVGALLTNLIKGDLLPSAHIWVTTRPAAADQIPIDYVDRMTEVRGFTDAQKEEYFMKRFIDKDVAKTIYSQIKKSQSLHILCHIPVFCSIIAAVLENVLRKGEQDEKGAIPKSLTAMFIHFLVDLSKKNDRKYTDSTQTLSDRNPQNSDVILSLGKLAFDQLENGNLIFTDEDLKKYGIDIRDAAVCSGVFTQILKEEYGLYEDQTFCFVHLSVQEFLAALYAYVSFINNGDNVLSTFKLSKLFRGKEDNFYQSAIDKALDSPKGHLDLFLRFLLGLSLETHQTLLRRLLDVKTGNRSKANKKAIEYIKKKIRKNPSQERSINLFHCLNELNDHYLVEELQQSLSSGSLSTDKLSPAQWSALVFILLSSEKELDVFDLKKYSASKECLLRLLPVVKSSNRAQLSGCNLSERCCKELSSVLSSSFSLREIDLSNNDLQDKGVDLLSAGLTSKHCKLETLRLSGCNLSETCCNELSSVLSSSCSLREIDLSNNDLRDRGVDLLSAGLTSKHCKLETLRLSGCNLSETCCNEISSVLGSSCSLREIDLSNNDLQDRGVDLLSAGLMSKHCKLETLGLSGCNLSETCCNELSSVLSSSCSLREIDLSNNDLQDRGVDLLSAGLASKHCILQTLRLSGCLVTEKGCSSLALALISNPSHLKVLDLSKNHPGDRGVQLLSARQKDPHCILGTLSVDHDGVCWLKRGLKKCPTNVCELTLDPNTAHKELTLSENNRKVTRVEEDQKYQDHLDRFTVLGQVMCRESLIGRCYWQVEWSGDVKIAVTYRGMNRTGSSENSWFGHNDKSWCLDCEGDANRYTLWHNNKLTVVPVRPTGSNRVGVYVDWRAGTLSFYKVSSDTLTYLHTFQSTFTEPLYAGFYCKGTGSSVSLCQKEV